MKILMERVALLMADKATPKNLEEETLMYAYHSGIEGKSLLKTYIDYPIPIDLNGDILHMFLLGFSSGAAVNKFAESQRNLISDEKLN